MCCSQLIFDSHSKCSATYDMNKLPWLLLIAAMMQWRNQFHGGEKNAISWLNGFYRESCCEMGFDPSETAINAFYGLIKSQSNDSRQCSGAMRGFWAPAMCISVEFLCLPCCIWFRCKWFCINVTYRWYAPRQRWRYRIITVHYCITIRIFHWFHRHCDDVFFLLVSFMQCECSIGKRAVYKSHEYAHTKIEGQRTRSDAHEINAPIDSIRFYSVRVCSSFFLVLLSSSLNCRVRFTVW